MFNKNTLKNIRLIEDTTKSRQATDQKIVYIWERIKIQNACKLPTYQLSQNMQKSRDSTVRTQMANHHMKIFNLNSNQGNAN